MGEYKRNDSRNKGLSKSAGRSRGGRDSGRSRGRDSGRSRSSSRFGGRSSDRRDFDRSGRKDSSRSNPRSSSRFGGRDSDRIEKTEVTCDSCKKRCEVPFKPTSNKPIYCDTCFKKNSGSKSNNYGKELVEINQKLDKIMKALEVD